MGGTTSVDCGSCANQPIMNYQQNYTWGGAWATTYHDLRFRPVPHVSLGGGGLGIVETILECLCLSSQGKPLPQKTIHRTRGDSVLQRAISETYDVHGELA